MTPIFIRLENPWYQRKQNWLRWCFPECCKNPKNQHYFVALNSEKLFKIHFMCMSGGMYVCALWAINQSISATVLDALDLWSLCTTMWVLGLCLGRIASGLTTEPSLQPQSNVFFKSEAPGDPPHPAELSCFLPISSHTSHSPNCHRLLKVPTSIKSTLAALGSSLLPVSLKL